LRKWSSRTSLSPSSSRSGGTVSAKARAAHRVAQVAVRGRNHARPRHPPLGLAQALELPVLQHPQQLRLHLEGQLADLVEEQRPVLRVLEVARLGARRAGEGALGIAEERRLHQRGRDGGAVEREIGLRRAAGHAVQAGRHELLAAARLALDEHRMGRVGELRELPAQPVERRALADQAEAVSHGRRRRALGRLERALQRPAQRRRLARLGDELPCAQRPRVPGVRRVVLAREHEDLHLRRVREEVGDELEAFVGAVRRRRQAEVHQREAGRLGKLAQQLDGVLARVAGLHVEIRPEREGERVRDQRIVVHDEQRRPAPGARSAPLLRCARRCRHGCTS